MTEALPRPALTRAQRERRERNKRRARERQLMYPRDETGKQIIRESPRNSFPYVEGARSMRAVMEHPAKHPNEFLYLLQFSQEETSVACYAWFFSTGKPYRQSPMNPQGKIYPSLVAAIEDLLRAGWLDTSW